MESEAAKRELCAFCDQRTLMSLRVSDSTWRQFIDSKIWKDRLAWWFGRNRRLSSEFTAGSTVMRQCISSKVYDHDPTWMKLSSSSCVVKIPTDYLINKLRIIVPIIFDMDVT